MTIEVFHTRDAKRHPVCVTPCAKGFNATVFHYNHSMRQGRVAFLSYHAVDKKGKQGLIIPVYLLQLLNKLSLHSSAFCFIVVHMILPPNRFLTAAVRSLAPLCSRVF